MSKEVDAVVAFAEQIVAAAPALREIDSWQRRAAELKKNISGLEATYAGLQAGIAAKMNEHDKLIAKTKADIGAAWDVHQSKMDESVNIAESQALNIVNTAKRVAKKIDDETKNKELELGILTAETEKARAVLENINSIIKTYQPAA